MTESLPTTSLSSSSTQSASLSESSQYLSLDDPIRERIRTACEEVRQKTPLAQSFTNFVTINLVANAQLAAGGSAAMSFLPDDIEDIDAISGASYINVGTLLPSYKDDLGIIAKTFFERRSLWVLDPVAAGLGSTRTHILKTFADYPPTIVRANASEIIALCGIWGISLKTDSEGKVNRPAGVESIDDVDSATLYAIELARYLREHNATHTAAVAVSGERDLITDGDCIYRLPGGDAMMTKITGAGCSLGGVTATYLAVSDPLTAALAASLHYNRASEQAGEVAKGPGSFQTAFLDALWQMQPAAIAASRIIEMR
ncbi:hydroxyethylthiazole kinase [Bifidobacterium aquikefiri]|uniref:hydroxyethylthiazole kinase n=1 Tax=Bifidobacterium aquikefiri TaxID=1653207 RepID=UPI0023F4C30E|nr:hydroxyethylthiazole kinase [Bifidobacterium aquikefiri]